MPSVAKQGRLILHLNRKAMKIDRQEVHGKYSGHCAYCGWLISVKDMQVDHIIPKRNFHKGRINYDVNDIKNLNPACRVCNNWKHTWSIEEFRREIGEQVDRAFKTSSNFRMALRYGQIKLTQSKIVFYFERLKEVE